MSTKNDFLGNIRVFCRLRPTLQSENTEKNLILHDSLSDAVIVNAENGVKKFLFDRIFGQNHNQVDVSLCFHASGFRAPKLKMNIHKISPGQFSIYKQL